MSAVVAACGVPESRVAALEAELAAMKQQQQQQSSAEQPAAQERVDKAIAETREGQKKLEEMTETLARQVSDLAAAPKPAAASGAASPEAGHIWAAMDAALGLPASDHVKLEGDEYKVSRPWLIEELDLALAGNKLPKVAADKKANGVAVRGIKPKSFLEVLGLKNNDVVVAVGDRPTPTPAELAAALKAATGATSVKVKRKAQDVVLRYALVD
jgi:hypothetical protein